VAAAAVAAAATFALYHTSRLAAERDEARLAAAQAHEVSELLVGLFDRDPFAADAERLDTLSVRSFLLGRGAAAVDGLDDQPAIQARLLTLLSRLHAQVGEYDGARAFSTRAVALYDSLGEAETVEAAEAHTALATVLEYRGAYAEAEGHYRRALALHRALRGGDDVGTAEAMNNLAALLEDVDGPEAAAEALRLGLGALAIYRRRLGDDHLDLAQAHNNVGVAYYLHRDYARAAAHYRQALDARRRQLGDHPLVANTQSNLANLLHEQGRPDEAVGLFREAIRIWRGTLGADHPMVSTGLFGLGEALRDLGRLEEAEAALLESGAIDRAALPPDHPYLADGLVALAQVRTRRGLLARAEADLREALAIYRRRPDTTPSDRAEAEAALGTCLLRQGRAAEAAPLLRSALPHLAAAAAATARAELARAEAAGS
jgi:tetratricopeptide (TPR) repeat protein